MPIKKCEKCGIRTTDREERNVCDICHNEERIDELEGIIAGLVMSDEVESEITDELEDYTYESEE